MKINAATYKKRRVVVVVVVKVKWTVQKNNNWIVGNIKDLRSVLLKWGIKLQNLFLIIYLFGFLSAGRDPESMPALEAACCVRQIQRSTCPAITTIKAMLKPS